MKNKIRNHTNKITHKKVNKECSGFGLHLCKLMIEKNKDFLELESEKNVGTIVSVSLLKASHE